MRCLCLECGEEYHRTWNSFRKVRHLVCPECAHERSLINPEFPGNKNKKSTEKFQAEVQQVNPDIEIIGEYTGMDTEVKCRNTTCGHVYTASPRNLLRGTGCWECYGTKRKTTEEFIDEVEKLEEDYEIIGSYINDNTKIAVEHLTCGTEYQVTPRNFLSGRRCPFCKSSKGERYIEKVLIKYGVPFVREKGVLGLYSDRGRPLRFDFITPLGVIEYNGIQHYEPIEFFGGVEGYKTLVKHDNRKKEFTEDKNIPLHIIHYKDYERIPEIIEYIIRSGNNWQETVNQKEIAMNYR